MGIKEKDLLELLNESSAVQRAIRNICKANDDMTAYTDRNSMLYKEKIQEITAKLNQTADELQKYKTYSEQLQQRNNLYEQENSKLRKTIHCLEVELQNTKSLLQSSLSERQVLEKDITNLSTVKQNLTAELNIAAKSLQDFKRQFKQPVEYLDMYHALSVPTRDGLSDVICDRNEILFIASCTNADNLKKMWEYTKEITGDDYKQNDVDILKKIFDYFFEIFNQSLPEPIYERDPVEIGDEYDEDEYVRSRDSATSGSITKIVLRGYRSINTGYTICKSVVRI